MLEIRTTADVDMSEVYLWNANFIQLLRSFRDVKNTKRIVTVLNMINNQGIEDVSLVGQTYVWRGETYHLSEMGTAERMFLVTCCVVEQGKHLNVVDYPDELSPKTSRIYMDLFKNADVTVYLKSRCSAFAGAANERGICLQWS
ncbi:hypothetical protein [Brotaphodocola sp.]|uniref:hypothetical protein n=1 Tax=Brotaphodocola sp. TaxID=3073577 RepID=UPI003D7EAE7B